MSFLKDVDASHSGLVAVTLFTAPAISQRSTALALNVIMVIRPACLDGDEA